MPSPTDKKTHTASGDPGVMFRVIKRGLDILAGSLGLLMVSPILAGCALWIKVCDNGPVLHRQWRVGRDGWLFQLYKLRTMRIDAETPGSARFAQARDPRILPGCAWMRKTHMDELPQLFNILLGQMSLVGPRPERPEIHEKLRRHLPQIDRRLNAAPGLTGLAQVRQGYANDLQGARRKLAMDIRYLRNRGLINELRLLLATAPKVWDRSAM